MAHAALKITTTASHATISHGHHARRRITITPSLADWDMFMLRWPPIFHKELQERRALSPRAQFDCRGMAITYFT